MAAARALIRVPDSLPVRPVVRFDRVGIQFAFSGRKCINPQLCANWCAAFHHLGFNRLAGRIGDTIDCFKKRDNSGAIDQRFRAYGIEDRLTGRIKPRRVGGNRRVRELEQ